jgi:mono/diheme cytochrome c family protein
MSENEENNQPIEAQTESPAEPEIAAAGHVSEDDAAHPMHAYAGGQILERTDVTLSPYLKGFWLLVVIVIIAVTIGFGFIAQWHPLSQAYNRPEGLTTTGYMSAEAMMSKKASFVEMTSPAMIDMYQVPRPQGQDLKGAISAGSDVYQTYCNGCHGPNQDGNGPNSVALDPKPRNLRDQPFMQAMSYQRIWTSVHKGVPGTAMPRWENVINDGQIQDVICYVLSLTAPTDAKTGQFIRPSAQVIAGSSPASPSNIGGVNGAPAH